MTQTAVNDTTPGKNIDCGMANIQYATLADNWKVATIPQQQRGIADRQLHDLREGNIHPVFASLQLALQAVKLDRFSLLDAACASGYYYEVIRTLDCRKIAYTGSDYSPAMIEAAKTFYPDVAFEVQDVTKTSYADHQFNVVLLSGAIEHIPAYHEALSESCRVAKDYLIIHRCPLTHHKEHESTVNIQYGAEILKMYFSKPLLLEEIRTHGFSLVQEIETYRERGFRGGIRRVKNEVKTFRHKQQSIEEIRPSVQTFVFWRHASQKSLSI